jgi:hypothetical protein
MEESGKKLYGEGDFDGDGKVETLWAESCGLVVRGENIVLAMSGEGCCGW